MVKRQRNRIILIVLIIIFLVIFWSIRNNHSTLSIAETDSIECVNDTLKQKIKEIDSILIISKYDYEAKYNSVTNQSVDSDCIFFSKYLENLKKSSTFVDKNN